MIKVGIIGGSNPMAGELIRLLINHPDIELIWVNSARYAGRLLSDVHHGLIGETEHRIAPVADLDAINALFIFRHKGQTIEWLQDNPLGEDIRVIDLSVDMRDKATAEKHGFVYGLPELNRKAMVRGARRAVVPHPAANAIALGLLPLAKEDALKGDITATVSLPTLGEPVEDKATLLGELSWAVSELQPDGMPDVNVCITPPASERVLTATVETATELNIGEITHLFEEFYDDHNFVFLVDNELPEDKEVEGTNKCLVHLDKRDGRMVATLKMDGLLKGAAGTAVHDMNLLFGLHERVGLTLKASRY